MTKKAKETPMMDNAKYFKGDLLQGEYDEAYLKRNGMFERTCKRKLRYWCFRIRSSVVEGKILPESIPENLQEYVESLPGFAGWKYFAVTWDVHGGNPFTIVLRLQSVWEEWDTVMNRVAIPIDAPPEQIHSRIQALTNEYARKNR